VKDLADGDRVADADHAVKVVSAAEEAVVADEINIIQMRCKI
jgi:hypothetical protein